MPSHTAAPSPGGSKPPSVNFHLWKPCDMRCRYCFAVFDDVLPVLPRGHLAKEDALEVTRRLARAFRKVSFAGGEPLLCPWFPELVQAAKAEGAVTMIVTNGGRFLERFHELAGSLDWVAVSIDSASEATHLSHGRALRGRTPLTPAHYQQIAARAAAAGIRLKVNTVVTLVNAGEDLAPLLRALRPARWKALRVLPVRGQNDERVEPLICSDAQFQGFIERHRALAAELDLAAEDNDDMRGSYAMVDPAGRFFDNVEGEHRYSAPILQSGLEAAWSEVRFSMERFLGRGGDYDFGSSR